MIILLAPGGRGCAKNPVRDLGRGNEINTAVTLNGFLTREIALFLIVNQKYQKAKL